MRWFIGLVMVMGCQPIRPNSDEIQRKEQERLSLQSTQSVGMPAIVNFQEKRIYKMILDLRDTEIKTITYTQDRDAKLHKLCDSIGYGIPYATQYTNPQRIALDKPTEPQKYAVVLPQADPNGLFSPASADGTWILCYNPQTKKVSPVYTEPKVIVSPFELKG